MKNKHVEQLKWRAKLSHRTRRYRDMHHGIIVGHRDDDEHPATLSWWDDVAFGFNDYLVNVAWTHPRFAYKDAVDNLAYQACAHVKAPRGTGSVNPGKPNYRKVGKSRKKIVSYPAHRVTDGAYDDALCAAEARIARDPDNGIMITPSMTMHWTTWSRFVCLCAPIDVRGVEDRRQLVLLTKALLKRQTSLAQQFPGYTYSQQDWVAEFQDTDVTGLLAHAANT